MEYFKKTILPVLVTGIWINISETLRWEFLIKDYWVEHYQQLNLIFPLNPMNGIVWLIWGFLIALIIFILSKKFTLLKITMISWIAVFIMVWIVLWNIDILPAGILWYVVPLSLFEVFIGALICKKLSPE